MRGIKATTLFLILATIGLALNFGFVQAQSALTQFGNINHNCSWNLEGDVIVASQFSIQQSITVSWISSLTQDESPSSVFRLGIFSDSNNQPNICLALTPIVPSQPDMGWYQLPLSNSVTLQPGTYWLAETDSGAGVIKYIDNQASTITVYTPSYGSPSALQNSLGSLDVGSQLSATLITLSGSLAIVASSGPPSIPDVQPPPTYAESAQCWLSSSSTDPHATDFAVGSPVYIYWSPNNPSTGVVNIWVYFPAGTSPGHSICCSFIELAPTSSPVSFVPTYAGTWVIDCNGYSTTTIIQNDVPGNSYFLFVAPEDASGALLSIVVCFAALGLFILRHSVVMKKAT
jgi:hypothetical protein